MTIELFEKLIASPEDELLDFKRECYDFFSKDEKVRAKLIKDIIAFGNTKREKPAYIIMGIEETAGGINQLGVTNMPDDAKIQQVIQGKIYPHPKIKTYTFKYKKLSYGIIEIPVWGYAHPLHVSVKMGNLASDKVYYRSGSSTAEADPDRISQTIEWLKEVRENSKPLPDPMPHEAPPEYIPRTIQQIEDVSMVGSSFFGKETLKSAVATQHRIAILGAGLSGKTTELKQLASELSNDHENYVHLISLENNLDTPIAQHIKDIERLDQSKLYVLLDGLDEVAADSFDLARRMILQFANQFKNCKIVVSCRNNFYTTNSSDERLSTLSSFMAYQLNPLDSQIIDGYLDTKLGKNKQSFVTAVHRKNIRELIDTPYYLVKLVKEFLQTESLADDKSQIFRREIREQLYSDIQKNNHGAEEIAEEETFKLLQKIAFVMQLMGTRHIQTSELLKLIPNKKAFSYIKQAASVFYSTTNRDKHWKFSNNSTQEFLAASVLAKMKHNKILKIITIAPHRQLVRPDSVGTLGHLISLLESRSTVRRKLIKLLVKHNDQILVSLQPDVAKEKARLKVFIKILKRHREEQRYLNRNLYPAEDLARFAEFPKTFDYLLNEMSEIRDIPFISNALHVVNFFSLSEYPIYREKFKNIYEKILFEGDAKLHHLAIGGYSSLFKLNQEEFNRVFMQFKDNSSTWIRYQLFAAIHISGQQNTYVKYLIAETKKIIANEIATLSSSGEQETRLANEDMELSSALKKLDDEKALIHFLSAMQKDLGTFNYSVYYDDVVAHLLQKATDQMSSVKIDNAVRALFMAQHENLIHNDRLRRLLSDRFSQFGKLDPSLKVLYEKNGLDDHETKYAIATFAGKSFIDFLETEVDKRKVTKRKVQDLRFWMSGNENPSTAYFIEKFGPFAKPKAKKSATYQAELVNKRNLKAIFDRKSMIAEVQLIFNSFGKDKLEPKDRLSRNPSYYDPKFCEAARSQINIDRSGDRALDNIKSYITSKAFSTDLPYRLYYFLLRYPKAVLSKEQRARIVKWCNQSVGEVNFETALSTDGQGTTSYDRKAIVLSFFLRLLKLDHYPEETYLEMLAFRKHNDSLEPIIDFVKGAIGFAKTTDRVLENIARENIPFVVYSDYIDWINRFNITQAIPLLAAYLKKSHEMGNYEVLRCYLDLGGKLSILRPVLELTKGNFHDHLMEKFVAQGGGFIKKYVQRRFEEATSDEVKLRLSYSLIRLQQQEGLDYYLEYVRKNFQTPEDDYIANPLHSLQKIKFLSQLLDYYEFSQQQEFNKNAFGDFGSICLVAIQNLALHGDNFSKSKVRVKKWLNRRNKDKKHKLPMDVKNSLTFIFENIEKQHRLSETATLSLEKASYIFKKMNSTDQKRYKI